MSFLVLQARAQLLISEFMADNTAGLTDEDGDNSDWIEIWNPSGGAVVTTGWSLTDSAGTPYKWRFPTFTMTGGARRVIFASGKDRRNPGANLHTNFKLSSDGEYLALINASGTAVQVWNPFPAQAENVSYGLPGAYQVTPFGLGSAVRWQVPVSSNDFATNFVGWATNLSFNDSGWTSALLGVGYERGSGYGAMIGTNGNCETRTYNVNQSVMMRVRFVVTNLVAISNVTLRMKYDDGFVAWLNGAAVGSDAAPTSLAWNSAATYNRDENLNNAWTYFTVTNGASLLTLGTNLLTLHGLNFGSTSSDLLELPELDIAYGVTSAVSGVYLLSATPGAANTAGTDKIGPAISGVTDNPPQPLGGSLSSPIVVTARVAKTLKNISSVTLYHRIMFTNETALPMTAVSSGVYTASIPTTNLPPGYMLRWRVEAVDTASVTSGAPVYVITNDSDRYYGTVAQTTATNLSMLPVFHWFIENYQIATNGGSGTKCSVYFRGRFYDNVQVDRHGQTSSTFTKKPFDFDFNTGNKFRMFGDNGPTMDDMNMLSNFGDKTKCRSVLAHDTLRRIGAAWLQTYTVRVHTNGAFYSVQDLMEDGDEKWCQRLGYVGEPALYKAYDALLTTGGSEKKSRLTEDKSDLQALLNGLNPTNAMEQRLRYAYDNVDIPMTVNYLVGRNAISDQDHGHKNYYVCRDTEDTKEWALFPWDVDLSFGHNWTGTYFSDVLFQTNVLQFAGGSNRFYNTFYQNPDLAGMVLRRYRTIMDRVVQAPSTPTNQLIWESVMNGLIDQIDPIGQGTNSDAYLDFVKWGSWGSTNIVPPRPEQQRVAAIHFPGRRDFLFNQNPTLSSGAGIPASQPTNVMISFGAYEVSPAGGVTQEYFTVVNTNAIYVDISGWQVTGAVTHTFRAGTVLPPPGTNVANQGTLFVAKNARGFRSRTSGPGSNQYCFVQQGYSGQLSARGEALYLIDDTGRAVASTAWTGTPTAAQTDLRVTEVMYHPSPTTTADSNAIPWVLDQDFEYLELRNIGTNTLNLAGVKFTAGVEFTFPTNFTLAAGDRTVVVTSTNAFRLRYGTNAVIAGVVTGFLDNAGETIQLTDAIGELVQEFMYNNAWYPVTDGHGFSLVIRDEYADWSTWDLKASWRPSGNLGGNAGTADPGAPSFPELIVNEVLAHTDLPQVDAIELYNPSGTPADIGGWYLTDDFATPRKYKFPSNTTIGAWGHLFVDESHFNTPSNAPTSFRLSSTGDDVWLFSSAPGSTNLTGYALQRTFAASANGVSFGRYVTSIGEEPFVLQGTNSLGVTNGYPRVGPVVLAEILFQPPDLGTNNNERDEFIELANLSNASVPLHDPAIPTNTWRLRNAVDYDFPAGSSLGPTGRLLVVGFDPANTTNAAAFRATYGLATNVVLYGPWSGKLANEGETIELKMPDPANSNEVPYVLVEQVKYRPASPWPVGAAGTGWSLHRIMGNEFGDDPINWFAGPATPSADAPYTQDTDADGQADWMEWLSGTDATNATSYLALIGPSELTSTGIVLRWSGVAGRRYAIEVSTNLLGAPQFAPQTGNIPATLPDTTWTDVDATTNDVRVYRLRLER